MAALISPKLALAVSPALTRIRLVSVTDREGRIRDANDAFCQTTGYRWAELRDQDHRILASGVHPPGLNIDATGLCFWKIVNA